MNNLSKKLLPITIVLAFTVILLGAYTRLTNAGLGCPDWPGCYGQLIVSKVSNATFIDQFDSKKAWTEMIHRYLAGTLGLLITLICTSYIYSNFRNKKSAKAYILPVLLMGMLIFQALLGMWTVTLKLLPTVVMGHLLGGLITLSLLIIILLSNFKFKTPIAFSKTTKVLCFVTLIFIFIQIMLGGWTSSNYAALPCIDFPTCNGKLIPDYSTIGAMNPIISIGPNYEGGILSNEMRVTIQLFHRWGALISFILTLVTILNIRQYQIPYYTNFSKYLLALITCQVALGIINVKYILPLHVAITHNAIATLLLISFIVLNYKITQSDVECHQPSIISHYL